MFPWQHPSRNLGALVFDGGAGGSTTLVYRLDRFVPSVLPGVLPPIGWRGPYFGISDDTPEARRIDELMDRYAPSRVIPDADFEEKEWKKAPRKLKYNLYFGFPSQQALYKWFPPELVGALEEFGFKVRKVPAKRVWLSKSGQQVIFEPVRPMNEE